MGRIISPNILIEWIKDFDPDKAKPNRRRRWSWRWQNMWDNWLGFRNGPVPYTECYHGGSSVGPKLGSERRAALDKKFIRKKRSFNSLQPDWRRRRGKKSRGWKSNRKRKQWM